MTRALDITRSDVSSGWMPADYQPGLVSVIVPTYNRAHLIADALQSVADQTYRPIELVVVDDGSTDDTQQVVTQWARERQSEDFTVRCLWQPNAGAQVARNHGLKKSTGEFIQFLDSDDLLMPNKIACHVAYLKRWSVDYVYGITEFVNVRTGAKHQKRVKKISGNPWITAHTWTTNSILLRRVVCVTVGPWNEALSACQEYEYGVRIKCGGFQGGFVDEIADQARDHGGASITNQSALRYVQAQELASDRVCEHLKTVRGPVARCEYNRVAFNRIGIALRYARIGHHDDTRRCLAKANQIARLPVAWGYCVIWALSCVVSAGLLLNVLWKLKGVFKRFRRSKVVTQ